MPLSQQNRRFKADWYRLVCSKISIYSQSAGICVQCYLNIVRWADQSQAYRRHTCKSPESSHTPDPDSAEGQHTHLCLRAQTNPHDLIHLTNTVSGDRKHFHCAITYTTGQMFGLMFAFMSLINTVKIVKY